MLGKLHFPKGSVGPAAVQTGGEAGYLLTWQSFVLGFWGTRGKSRSCPLGSQIALSLSPMLSVGEWTPRVLTELPQWCIGHCLSGQCLPSTPGRGGYLVNLKRQMGVYGNLLILSITLGQCGKNPKHFFLSCDSKRSYTENCTHSMCTYY